MANEQTQSAQRGDVMKVSLRVKELRAVEQMRGSFEVLKDVPKPPFTAMLPMPTWDFERATDDKQLRVIGRFSFFGTTRPEDGSAPNEADAFVRADADFMIAYEMSEGPAFSDDDIRAFMQINSTMNAYPFWREFVYSSLARAGLATMLLPPFNPIKAVRDLKDQSQLQTKKTASLEKSSE
ncbi:hypothetical protein LBMAG48_24060 [Phycisphaerae bacterium]|nr:hypothetical protein LBMAG48_24060 [Phycisphaerae bacterium]